MNFAFRENNHGRATKRSEQEAEAAEEVRALIRLAVGETEHDLLDDVVPQAAAVALVPLVRRFLVGPHPAVVDETQHPQPARQERPVEA